MDDTLSLTLRENAAGKLVLLNGKTYTLLRLYRHDRLGGTFCLAVAGRTPLKADDLAEHWRVFRSGQLYLALDARSFSYHLIQGENATTDAPAWPRFKSAPAYYAFVGPTETAVQTQIRLTLERYRSQADPEQVLRDALRVPDLCGGPDAYLLNARSL